MAESEAWAQLRAYANAPTAPLDAAPPAGDEDGDTEPSEPGPTPDAPDEDTPEPGAKPGAKPRRRFHPGAIGPALDQVLPTGLVDRAARIPTPGGLFPLVAALLFFLLAIVPVDAQGHTRLEMLWRVLTGGASLPTSGAAALNTFDAASQALVTDAASQVLGTTPQDTNTLFQTWWGLVGSIL